MEADLTVTRSESMRLDTQQDTIMVRQVVRAWSAELGFRGVEQTKLVTAASELARNVLIHGGGGTMRIESVHNGTRAGLRLIFEDDGPGIPDIEGALRDGFSTTPGGSLGLGLGGTRRLVDEFHIASHPGTGTKVRILRWR